MTPMPNARLEMLWDSNWERKAYGASGADGTGCFRVRYNGTELRIVSSEDLGEGWEHVSVSVAHRCPNWLEMCFVKSLFWSDDEVVMQLHPAKADYVNNHPYCLHLWRPTQAQIPLPPAIYVGIKEVGEIKTPAEARQLRASALRSGL